MNERGRKRTHVSLYRFVRRTEQQSSEYSFGTTSNRRQHSMAIAVAPKGMLSATVSLIVNVPVGLRILDDRMSRLTSPGIVAWMALVAESLVDVVVLVAYFYNRNPETAVGKVLGRILKPVWSCCGGWMCFCWWCCTTSVVQSSHDSSMMPPSEEMESTMEASLEFVTMSMSSKRNAFRGMK